jgi:hypothetical protein
VFPLRHCHQSSFPASRDLAAFAATPGAETPSKLQQLGLPDIRHDDGYRSSPRLISTGGLHALPRFHLQPIPGFSARCLTWLPSERSYLGASFALRCFQRLSLPDLATRRLRLAAQPVHQGSVHSGPLVLGAAPLKPLPPTMDRDRTVSRRSEPSSRTALIGEQPNPWDLIQPQDATSRHRGAKPCRRCERLGKISLLSPG